MHVLASRPAIRIVVALWATFAVLLAVNLTLRLTPQEVRFVHQSPPTQSTPAQPTAPSVPIIVEAPPKVAPVLPPPRRGAEVQVQLTRVPATPSPVRRAKVPAPVVAQTSQSKSASVKREPARPAPVVEQEDPAPADPCAQGCDDPVPPDESSPGGEAAEEVQTTSPGGPVDEPAGES